MQSIQKANVGPVILRSNPSEKKYAASAEYLIRVDLFEEAQIFVLKIATEKNRRKLLSSLWFAAVSQADRTTSGPREERNKEYESNYTKLYELALTIGNPSDRDIALKLLLLVHVFSYNLREKIIDALSDSSTRDGHYASLVRDVSDTAKAIQIAEKIENNLTHDEALTRLAHSFLGGRKYNIAAIVTALRTNNAKTDLYIWAANFVSPGENQIAYTTRAHGYANNLNEYSKDKDRAYAGIVESLVSRFAQSECPSIYPTLKLMQNKDIRTNSILEAATALSNRTARFYEYTKTVSAYRRAEKRQKYDTYALDVKAQLSKISNDSTITNEATKKVLDGVLAKIKFFKR